MLQRFREMSQKLNENSEDVKINLWMLIRRP
jgi:hypothetical protein